MKKLFITFILSSFVTLLYSSPCTITYGKSASEKTAAQLLKQYLAKLTNNTYNVKLNNKSNIKFNLVIDSSLSKQEDFWSISSKNNIITLAGSNQRGLFYAISHFLEDYCNVFFFTPYEEYVPKKQELSLSTIKASGQPYFTYRHIYRGHTRKNDKGLFAILKILNNDNTSAIHPVYGGNFAFGPPRFVHTLWSYVHEKDYFAKHPEYFALLNGKRRAGRDSQVCFSNKEVAKIILQNLKKYLKQGNSSALGRKTPRPLLYDISINDNGNYCQCTECKKLYAKHGVSGALIYMLNYVAKNIKTIDKDIKITTLAYNFTVDAPKNIPIEDNIIIRLCPKINMAGSINDKDNSHFTKQVIQWSKVAKTLYIWDYADTYIKGGIGMPFASEFHYASRFKFYAQNKVKGIMFEQQFEPNGDMFELKFYLKSKLMENPFLDSNALINKFMKAYYQAAAKDILIARQKLELSRKKNNGYVRFMATPDELQFSTIEELKDMQRSFDNAEKAVKDNPLLLARVRRARRGLDRVCVYRALPKVLQTPTNKQDNYYSKEIALKAFNRLSDSWIPWLKRYNKSKELIMEAQDEMNQYKTILDSNIKVASKFATIPHYSFPAVRFQNHDLKAIKFVKDPDSEAGSAYKIIVEKNPKYYNPPFIMGFRDRSAKITTPVKFKPSDIKVGYNWYKLGTFVLPATADIFISRSWGIKLHLAKFPETRPLEFYVSLKFTGPLFIPNDQSENAIFTDRIIAIPQNKDK